MNIEKIISILESEKTTWSDIHKNMESSIKKDNIIFIIYLVVIAFLITLLFL